MLKNLPQLMLSAEKEAIIDSSDEIILENIFYKYKLSKFTKKKISLIKNNYYQKEFFKDEILIQRQKYDKYVLIISNRLNNYHKISKPQIYWERIIGLFVLMHIHHTRYIYNFFQTLENTDYSINLLNKNCFQVPEITEDYRSIIQFSNSGYEQLVAEYFQLFQENHNFNFHEYKKINKLKTSYIKTDLNLFERIISKKINNLFISLLLRITRDIFSRIIKPKVLLIETIFQPHKYLKLMLKSLGKIQFINNFSISHTSCQPDLNNREILFDSIDKNLSPYDKYFFQTLKMLLPKSWLENYNFRKDLINEFLIKNYNLKFIVSETSLETTQFLISEAKAKKVKYIMNEHNFLQQQWYGNHIWFFTNLCDKYLSLGWTNKSNNKIIPMGSLFNWKISQNKNKVDIPVLYITSYCQSKMTHIEYSHGESGSANIETYIKMNKLFFDTVGDNILNKIYFRSHPHTDSSYYEEYSLSDEDVFPEYIDKFLFVDNRKSIKADILLARAKILIINYLSTSWLQALVSDTPTIILWNKNAYKLDKKYQGFFDELISVNIVHIDSEQAGNFLKSIINDPNTWWNKKETIKARKSFLLDNFIEDQKLENFLIKLSN